MALPTREHILSAAARLYAEHGFRGTTTRAIAESAGVNEVTLFRLFGSKETLIIEAMRVHGVPVHVGTLPEVPLDPAKELTSWATQTSTVLLSMRSMIVQAMSDAEHHPEMPKCVARGADAAFDAIHSYLDRVREHGFIPTDAETHNAGGMLISSLFHDAMSREVMPQFFPPIADAPATYARLCLRALQYDPSKSAAQRRAS
ncbi:MAG: helix-turn-helix domain containing protein [Gemmatimonadetes bacterium]|nr:helix-turn-helix domain containing protein [Gemmatimonadota bacterium]